ncbi:MAG: histone deacetylase complex subunit SAP30 Sin3-binding domain-containing protein [archaeon]|nr:histone deacetylase complex subunit SAP30 Sin3-binding domain-containing protein [archaeon]
MALYLSPPAPGSGSPSAMSGSSMHSSASASVSRKLKSKVPKRRGIRKKQSHLSSSGSMSHPSRSLNLALLDDSALRRYKRHFKIRTKHNIPRSEMLSAVQRHSSSLVVDPRQVIDTFISNQKAEMKGKRIPR